MDAAALLKSQGWRGKGFSLHPTDNKVGLTNPLRISRNSDGRGIGQKVHYTSDQWWLAAFDQKLKGLDTSQKGTVVQSVKTGRIDAVAPSTITGKYTGAAGLYASFVRGEGLEGTIESLKRQNEEREEEESATDATATPVSSSGESVPDLGRQKKSKDKKETKEERKARKEAKKTRKEEKAKAKLIRKAAKKAAKKEAKLEAKRASKLGETKEERRARRDERRARKEAKRKSRSTKSEG